MDVRQPDGKSFLFFRLCFYLFYFHPGSVRLPDNQAILCTSGYAAPARPPRLCSRQTAPGPGRGPGRASNSRLGNGRSVPRLGQPGPAADGRDACATDTERVRLAVPPGAVSTQPRREKRKKKAGNKVPRSQRWSSRMPMAVSARSHCIIRQPSCTKYVTRRWPRPDTELSAAAADCVLTPSLFWAQMSRGTGCWIWQGSPSSHGGRHHQLRPEWPSSSPVAGSGWW